MGPMVAGLARVIPVPNNLGEGAVPGPHTALLWLLALYPAALQLCRICNSASVRFPSFLWPLSGPIVLSACTFHFSLSLMLPLSLSVSVLISLGFSHTPQPRPVPVHTETHTHRQTWLQRAAEPYLQGAGSKGDPEGCTETGLGVMGPASWGVGRGLSPPHCPTPSHPATSFLSFDSSASLSLSCLHSPNTHRLLSWVLSHPTHAACPSSIPAPSQPQGPPHRAPCRPGLMGARWPPVTQP